MIEKQSFEKESCKMFSQQNPAQALRFDLGFFTRMNRNFFTPIAQISNLVGTQKQILDQGKLSHTATNYIGLVTATHKRAKEQATSQPHSLQRNE